MNRTTLSLLLVCLTCLNVACIQSDATNTTVRLDQKATQKTSPAFEVKHETKEVLQGGIESPAKQQIALINAIPATFISKETEEETEEFQTTPDKQEKPTNSTDLSKVDAQFRELRSLSKEGEIFVSLQDKVVVVGGQICLDSGVLEMFACVPESKEHESIVVINSRAYDVHVGLLAIGAKTGKPAVFDPMYVPATGDEIEIEVHWVDAAGTLHKERAQDLLRNIDTGKAMAHEFVFGGSGFYQDEETGKKHYLAESGEVICVSNFGTAMIDIPVESAQLNEGLMFEAFKEKTPAIGTKVRLVLRKKETEKQADKTEADKTEADKPKTDKPKTDKPKTEPNTPHADKDAAKGTTH